MSLAMNPRQVVESAIPQRGYPGAAWSYGTVGSEPALGVAGALDYGGSAPKVEMDTLWDLASLTKIVATTSVAMVLYQNRLLDLESHASAYLPRFAHSGITLRQLLLHRSGMPAYASFQASCVSPRESEQALFGLATRRVYPPATEYSCMGFMVLQRVLENIGGAPLNSLAAELVFQPLGMAQTMYTPPLPDRSRCAPTEALPAWRKEIEDLRGFQRVQDEFVQGGVHDPAAFMMGGVSGNAGLFSTPADLAKWCLELAAGGDRVFQPEVVALFSARHDASATRALGFDTKSPEGSSAGGRFGPRSFGHTGYTGTIIWIDPDAKAFGTLLTNRVHPDDKSTATATIRPQFFDAVHREIHGAPAED